jgi:hypothetical protein
MSSANVCWCHNAAKLLPDDSAGSPVLHSFIIHNTGNVAIRDLTLTHSGNLSALACSVNTTGETFQFGSAYNTSTMAFPGSANNSLGGSAPAVWNAGTWWGSGLPVGQSMACQGIAIITQDHFEASEYPTWVQTVVTCNIVPGNKLLVQRVQLATVELNRVAGLEVNPFDLNCWNNPWMCEYKGLDVCAAGLCWIKHCHVVLPPLSDMLAFVILPTALGSAPTWEGCATGSS